MIKVVILCGIAFMIGNITWTYFNEPKIFYIPLSALLLSLFWELKIKYKNDKNSILRVSIDYLFLLSCGNLVKQIFYSETLKLVNDYIWGAVVTLWYLGAIIFEGRKQNKKIKQIKEETKNWKSTRK